jgi:NAD(P)-dependent dehydrogenase (short-subunit alcohol dehydrogenase family)
MKIDLSGTAALVTGASSGIGEAISQELGSCGARVAVHYNSGEERARAIAKGCGPGCEVFGADLSDPRAASDLFKTVAGTFGKVDLLVNNAGIFIPAHPEAGYDDWMGTWNSTIAVNLTSAGVLCREAIVHFMNNGGGRIVNISSRAAFRGETADYLAYAASKGGMISLSRSIARSFGKQGIKSFSIAPGYVRTPMTDEYLDLHEDEMIESELALGEMTSPGDIAPLVAFMASGRLDHATGCTIDINGGSYIR